jgi:hypothetical protein
MKKTILLLICLLIFTTTCGKDEDDGEGGAAETADLSSLTSRASFYQDRYGAERVLDKIVNSTGEGTSELEGTLNVRPIMHGVIYRGGANNLYSKDVPRSERNPLPEKALVNLCEEGFSQAIYLLEENFDLASKITDCSDFNGETNSLFYEQKDWDADQDLYDILSYTYDILQNDEAQPIYLHDYNGWHESGYVAAILLRQYCNYTPSEAVDYWQLSIDDENDSYELVEDKIRNFVKVADFMISQDLVGEVCPDKVL